MPFGLGHALATFQRECGTTDNETHAILSCYQELCEISKLPINRLVGHTAAMLNRASKRPKAKKTPFVWTKYTPCRWYLGQTRETLKFLPMVVIVYTDSSSTGSGNILYNTRMAKHCCSGNSNKKINILRQMHFR